MSKADQQRFRIRGLVVDSKTRRGIEGLRVEAWDKDLLIDDLVGSGITGDKGSFSLDFGVDYSSELFFDRSPDLFFKVFRDDTLIKSTPDSVLWNTSADPAEIVIELDGATTPTQNGAPFVVQGQVRQGDGSVVSDALVRAFDRDLRSEELLGEAKTDRDGHYKIAYTAGQFKRAEKQSADLIVRVLDANNSALVESPIFFNAPAVTTIDLTVGQVIQLSEYEQLINQITPLLNGLSLTDLTEDQQHQDITFLSGETGAERSHIEFVVAAARLSNQTAISAEAFYGLFRRNLPTNPLQLLSQNVHVMRRALESAIADNIVPAKLSDSLDQIVERLQELIAQAALSLPGSGEASLGALLGTAVSSRAILEQFLKLYIQNVDPIEVFWDKLRQHPDFQNGVVDDLQITLWLAAVTRDHLPMVHELQEQRRNTANWSPRDLARLDENDWRALIDKQVDGQSIGFPSDVPGENDADKSASYARTLARTMELAFPTAVFATQVAKFDAPGTNDLQTFFTNNATFDFRRDHIDDYVSQNSGALTGVQNPQNLTTQLKSMQRIFTLTPRYEEMNALLADGLDSAQSITQMDKSAFVEKYASVLGGPANSAEVYERATQISSLALLVFGKYSPTINSIDLKVTSKLPD
jgi:hypothetical protein